MTKTSQDAVEGTSEPVDSNHTPSPDSFTATGGDSEGADNQPSVDNTARNDAAPPEVPARTSQTGVALPDARMGSAEGSAFQAADTEALLDQAQTALASVDQPSIRLPEGTLSFKLTNLSGARASEDAATIDLLSDVELDLKIELGRTRMKLEDILQLSKETVVQLDKLAGDPVDIFVNGRLMARGEVLVLNDNFYVHVAELISGEPPS